MEKLKNALLFVSPSAALGSGLAVLIGVFQLATLAPTSNAVFPLQIIGLLLVLGSLGLSAFLRAFEVQPEFSLGVLSRSLVVFLSGVVSYIILKVFFGLAGDVPFALFALAALSWVPCAAICVGIFLLVSSRRRAATEGAAEDQGG